MDSTPNSFAATKMIECPFAVKWEIKEEKLTALKNSENGCLETQWFDASNIPGVKYSLDIYPNGDEENGRGNVHIYFHLNVGKEKKVIADYKVFIESANLIKEFNHIFENTSGWGGNDFTTSEFFDTEEDIIMNGKLIIKCQGTLKVRRECEPADSRNKWKDQSYLIKLWKRNDADFTIVVDNKTIQVHKSILSILSPVFKAMFNSGMTEAVENRMDITDFSYETVELALELMYDRKMSTLNWEEKIDVLIFFDKYDIQDLKDFLEASLAEDISLASVVRIATFSITVNSITLQERCMNFMVACFRMDRPIEDFDALDKDFAFTVLKNSYYKIVKT